MSVHQLRACKREEKDGLVAKMIFDTIKKGFSKKEERPNHLSNSLSQINFKSKMKNEG